MNRSRSLWISLAMLAIFTCALILFYGSSYRIVKYHVPEAGGSVSCIISTLNNEQSSEDNAGDGFLGDLGAYITRDARGWTSLSCDTSDKIRKVSLPTGIGNFTFYIYDSTASDLSVTRLALKGTFFEKKEIDRFIKVSTPLPLIDVGANVGLVALQAARQGRRVIAVEPIPGNALRLCRSALDFGHAHLVRVIGNAVSSTEGNVTLAMDQDKAYTHFEVLRSKNWGYGAVVRWAILLDRLLEVVRFKHAAIKIDVESHEGHVIAGAEKLFRAIDVRMVWMEWEHVKKKREFGAKLIIAFMRRHELYAHDLMSGRRLDDSAYMKWLFTVLWLKSDVSKTV